MNVASLELCKELYELSGWGDHPNRTHFNWRRFEGKTTGSVYFSYAEDYSGEREDPYDGRRPTGITHHIDSVAPAYDLGYLLRKLPPETTIHKYEYPEVKGYSVSYNWYDIEGDGRGDECDADTPEDAACKLAIELFKQGILKREVQGDE